MSRRNEKAGDRSLERGLILHCDWSGGSAWEGHVRRGRGSEGGTFSNGQRNISRGGTNLGVRGCKEKKEGEVTGCGVNVYDGDKVMV